MDLALLFFAFLWGLSGKSKGESPSDIKPSGPRQLPPPGGAQASTPAPWPQAPPHGLPPFPGSGWEFDEPPPPEVKQRAGQLVSVLWKGGSGTSKTEQTAGRWITYVAAIVASGKRGVVAYRVKRGGSSPSSRRAPAPTRTSAPSSGGMQGILTAVSPGWPQPTGAGSRVLRAVKGRLYRWVAELSGSGIGDLEAVKRGLRLSGATNIKITPGPPVRVEYMQRAALNKDVEIGVAYRVAFGNFSGTIAIVDGQEVREGAPSAQPVALGELRRGMGIKPQAPHEQVKIAQRKLGITADGRFGAGTEDAVRAFQTSRGLKSDGIVGPKTWAELFASGGTVRA
jgi:hypothetical protein